MWLFSLGENFAKMLAWHFMWGNFHDTTPISFITAYGFYFRVGVIFAKKTKAQKKRENLPHAKISTFTVGIQYYLPLAIVQYIIPVYGQKK